jgi:hypothetical protein
MMEHPQWLHVFLDVRSDVSQASANFWSTALGWPLGDPWPEHPEFRSFEPPDGDAYVHQQIGDHGPRIHFDLEVPDEAEVERLVALGASFAGEPQEWWPMISPGGLPFCLIRRRNRVRPPALSWDGHRSRLVQICIDSPAGLHDQEVAFWRSALNWRWAASESDEFAGKLHPPSGSSVQLLFQRLGEDDQGRRFALTSTLALTTSKPTLNACFSSERRKLNPAAAGSFFVTRPG